jgi:hypothetical protein
MYIITTTCCAKMAGKEETPKCMKKTVTWTNEMIEDIKIRSSFLIQVSCMVYTIKTLEFKKLEWRFGCKTCIVYTGLNAVCLVKV